MIALHRCIGASLHRCILDWCSAEFLAERLRVYDERVNKKSWAEQEHENRQRLSPASQLNLHAHRSCLRGARSAVTPSTLLLEPA